MPQLLFVYGTLKKFQPNNHYLYDPKYKSEWVAVGSTNERWPMIIEAKSSVRFSSKVLPHQQIKYPVDFNDELKIGDVRYDKMIQITIKVQLF